MTTTFMRRNKKYLIKNLINPINHILEPSVSHGLQFIWARDIFSSKLVHSLPNLYECNSAFWAHQHFLWNDIFSILVMTRNLIDCPLPKQISGSEDRPSSQVETRCDTPDRPVLTSTSSLANVKKHLRIHRETSTFGCWFLLYLLLPPDTSSRKSQPVGDGAASAVSLHVASAGAYGRRRIADVGRRRGSTKSTT